jgi:hypothetical protein
MGQPYDGISRFGEKLKLYLRRLDLQHRRQRLRTIRDDLGFTHFDARRLHSRLAHEVATARAFRRKIGERVVGERLRAHELLKKRFVELAIALAAQQTAMKRRER